MQNEKNEENNENFSVKCQERNEEEYSVNIKIEHCKTCGNPLIPLGDIWLHPPNTQCQEIDGRFLTTLDATISKAWDEQYPAPETDIITILNNIEHYKALYEDIKNKTWWGLIKWKFNI